MAMAPKKVSVTVKFSKPGIQPPIYLAGSFSEPAWQPEEMQHTIVGETEYQYHKEVHVDEGKEYQYKFRIGDGNWWVVDEDSQIATDDIGNRNNLLTVPIYEKPQPIADSSNMSSSLKDTPPVPVEAPQEPHDSQKIPSLKDAIVKHNPIIDKLDGCGEDKDEVEIEKEDENAVHQVETLQKEDEPSGFLLRDIMAEQEKKLAEAELRNELEVEKQDTTPALEVPAEKPQEAIDSLDISSSKVASVEDKKDVEHEDKADIIIPTVVSEDVEHLDGITEIQSIETAPAEFVTDENVSPTLVVEKVDSTPSHGDDFGANATYAQKDAHLLRTEDAEPDYIIVRSGTRTPDLAAVAAEVADSAATLDRDTPIPPISDDEAGHIGVNHISQTPIPEVADTASEVANSAAVLDKEDFILTVETPPPQTENDGIDSGATTPWDERAPRFAHECPELPEGELQPASPTRDDPEGKGPLDPYANIVIDRNDPSLEEFPSEREAILEHVRSCQSRLSEDETFVDGIPPSPVVGANHNPDQFNLPSPSPNILARHGDRSPSLNSIPEEQVHREELLSSLPKAMSPPKSDPGSEGADQAPATNNKDERKTSVDVQDVPAESPPSGLVEPTEITPEEHMGAQGVTQMPAVSSTEDSMPITEDDSKRLDDENPRELVSHEEGPNITVQPATPHSSLSNKGSDPFSKPVTNSAKATAIEEENGRSQLRSRKQPSPQRPITPTSMRSAGKDAKSKNFLKAFLNLVFVEWIGGLIRRLCRGGRHTLLAIIALVIITVAPALYFSA